MDADPKDDDQCALPANPLPSRASAGLLRWVLAFVLIVAAGFATFYRSMERGLNHDEHQFLAPGILLSRHGLLPYRDYPLFHMPNLIYAYAAMDSLTSDPVFGAKMVSVLASTGVVALIFWLALLRSGNTMRPWERLWAGAAVAVLLLFDPLFLFTSGKTWNHELPAFFLVLATVFHVESVRKRRNVLAVLSGCAAGLAAGTRLTYAPACAAFLVHLALAGGEGWKCRIKAMAAWSIGCTVGLGPAIYFFLAHREAFLFDNFSFPRLTLQDPDNERVQRTIKLSKKIRFLVKEVLERSWPLAVLFLGLAVLPVRQAFQNRRLEGGAVFMLILAVTVVAGCFAPTRYQYQHFFALSGVAAIGIIYFCKETVLGATVRKGILGLVSALALVSVIGFLSNGPKDDRPYGLKAYRPALAMRDPALWFSNKYRIQAGVLQPHVPGGERILTLAPTAALVASRPIFPEFATGVFAWRNARLVPPELRKRLHFVAPDEIAEFLRDRPPAGILSGVEDEDLEAPMVAWAKANGYQNVELPKGRILWKPSAEYRIHRRFYRLEDRVKKPKATPAEKKTE